MSPGPERHERIGELFDGALARPTRERAAFLAEACAGDAELLGAVERLLENHSDSGSFLDPLLARSHAATLLGAIATPGGIDLVRVGPYQIRKRLGEGGMGTVYLATQSEPIQRDVALKVIKPGMNSRSVIARFESERRVLALMAHPNIAQVFDVGTTEAGLPYFAMELVDGLPITRFCEENKLGIRERIELFIPVCQAIQHAHQKGIIHRDIKPSNVLVAVQEGRATPKVIDFGLAKALGEDWTGTTMATHIGTIVGTLQYMSPEQAELGAVDVDTRSDVYSLGALLYELLTGMPPLETGRIEKEAYLLVLQRIREVEPAPPSVRLKESAVGQPLDSELDWIPMKALEKERARRYETVNGMVLDLRRYLSGEAVEAAPPSRLYRVGKFVRKHRPWIATAAAFCLLVAGAGAFSVWMTVRATQAEQETRAINEFLQRGLLGQAAPTGQAGRPDPQITMRTVLDRAATQLNGRFQNQPRVEASLRNTIGSIYTSLGLHKQGQRELRRAVEMRKSLLGNHAEPTIESQTALAANLLTDGATAEAETLLAEAWESARVTLPRGNEVRLGTEAGIARVKYTLGKLDDGIHLAEPAEQDARRFLGTRHERTSELQYVLFTLHYGKMDYAAAKKYLTAALETSIAVDGPEAAGTMMMRSGLAMLYTQQGKWAEAGAEYEDALAVARRVRGPAHPNTLVAMYNLALHYMQMGRYSEADALLRENLKIRGTLYRPDHPRTLLFMTVWANFHIVQGKLTEAQAILDEYMPLLQKTLPEDHPTALYTQRNLADLRERQNRLAEAEVILEKNVERMRRKAGVESSQTLEEMTMLARARLRLGRYADAEGPAKTATEGLAKVVPEGWHRHFARMAYGVSLMGQGKDGRKELEAGFAGLQQRKELIPIGDSSFLKEAERWRANGR